MANLWSSLFSASLALQALLCWTCGNAQAPGFLSIDCGSTTNFTDTETGNLEWISDAGLVMEGESETVGGADAPYATMRVFTGNQSKYCYSLSNSAVTEGAFFLVRASFWKGDTPAYTPKNPDGHFRFKLLIDADEWLDIDIANDSTGYDSYGIYTRALRSSINVCLARSTADGDDPFISALELRPLPSSLSTTLLINSTSRRFISVIHSDYVSNATTQPSITRYPADSLDRLWITIVSEASGFVSKSAINMSNDQDIPPASALQTYYDGEITNTITATFLDTVVNAEYYCAFHFAEIDPAVNASGLHEFNLVLNGQPKTLNDKPIDVFAEVGANAAYELLFHLIPGASLLEFRFSATSTSVFPPFLAAAELFRASNFSAGSSPSDVSAIEDLKTSMNLDSYSGDPCLPNGFGYSWLTCMLDTNSKGGPRIMSISLSNYSMGGEIPKTINTLTMLKKIFLDGNNLVGSIPDMSALASLETLKLENNNLTGEIPATLLERKKASTLDFEFSGNPLCQNNSGVACILPPSSSKSKIHTGLIIGVTIPILLVLIIGIIGLTIFCHWKNKTQIILKESLHNNFSTQQEIPLYQSPWDQLSKCRYQYFLSKILLLKKSRLPQKTLALSLVWVDLDQSIKGLLRMGTLLQLK